MNKSFSVTAEIDIPEKGAEGMVFTHGGLTGGYGIYLRDGKAHFVYNMLAVERFTITSEPLPTGKVALAVNVAYEGAPGERGKPAAVTITANGREGRRRKAAEDDSATVLTRRRGRRRHGHGIGRGLHLHAPFKFTGKIERVTVDLR